MSDSDTNKNALPTYLKDVVLDLDDDGQDYGNEQDDEMGFLNHFFSEEGPCQACQSGADVGHLNIGPHCGSPEQKAKWIKMKGIWDGLRPETKRAMVETIADDAKRGGRRKVTTKKQRSTKRRSVRRAKRRKTKRRKLKRRKTKRRKTKRRKTRRKH